MSLIWLSLGDVLGAFLIELEDGFLILLPAFRGSYIFYFVVVPKTIGVAESRDTGFGT